jgi:Ran-binding protein 1
LLWTNINIAFFCNILFVYLPLLLLPDAKSFMETFQEVAESQKPVDDKTASAAAGLVEKLSVEDKTVDAEKKDEEKSEEKTEEKESAAAVEASKEDANKKVEEPASSA